MLSEKGFPFSSLVFVQSNYPPKPHGGAYSSISVKGVINNLDFRRVYISNIKKTKILSSLKYVSTSIIIIKKS